MSFSRLYYAFDRALDKQDIQQAIERRLTTESVQRLLEIYAIERDCYKERLLRDIARYRLIPPNDNVEQYVRDMRDYAEFMRFNRGDFPDMIEHIEQQYGLGVAAEARAQEALEGQRQRWLAVAMARHRRLGSNATLGALEPELIRAITERNGEI